MAADVLPESMPHRFTPEDFDVLDFSQIEPLLETLADMDVADRQGLEAFLDAWDEFDAFVGDAAYSIRLQTARHTDDDAAKQQWMRFLSEINPRLQEWDNRLNQKMLDSPALDHFEETAYAPFIRQVRRAVELFREENIPLNKEVSELATRYGEISGGWSVAFDGEEYTFAAMQKFLQSTDRDVRQRAWEARTRTRFADAEELDEIWDRMFELRHQIAQNAGFDNYRDYIFAEKMRDYDPDACYAYHELIESEVMPLVSEIIAWQTDQLGLDSFRPWDASADPEGKEPLEPFEQADELKDGVERMMRRLDDELGEQFGALKSFMDLESRPNKEQGGFMMTFPAQRRPFIFANATGRHGDIVTLLHEAGHAFHSLAALPNKPMTATPVPMEFNEVASMAMELLHYDTLDEFYDDPDERRRAIHSHLRRLPKLLVSVAMGDSFQHWLYTHPDHTAADRRERWLHERERFSSYVDTDGIPEEWMATSWHEVLHFFQVPFYYIEYGFAQLGALQVAVNAEKDKAAALEDYRHALALAANADTAGLYAAAGAQFVPTTKKLRELVGWIRARLFEE